MASGAEQNVCIVLRQFERKTPGVCEWFAVHTRPRMDRLAGLNLARQGFATFSPAVVKTVRHARRFRTIQAPLFPGYIFVTLDLARDRWRSVNGTYGVTGMVMSGGLPAQVPPGVVEALMAVSAESGLMRFEHALAAGQKVRILAGPFANFIATLEEIDDAGRVRLLLAMMGSHVSIAATSGMLIPA